MCHYDVVRYVIAVDVASYKTVSEEGKKTTQATLHIPDFFKCACIKPDTTIMENHRPFLVLLSFAFAVGFISVVFVLRWVLHFREGLAWDGGAKEFNWHPLLAVTGFIFLQGIGK